MNYIYRLKLVAKTYKLISQEKLLVIKIKSVTPKSELAKFFIRKVWYDKEQNKWALKKANKANKNF